MSSTTIFHTIVDQLDEIKGSISDNQYKNLVETVAKAREIKCKLVRIKYYVTKAKIAAECPECECPLAFDGITTSCKYFERIISIHDVPMRATLCENVHTFSQMSRMSFNAIKNNLLEKSHYMGLPNIYGGFLVITSVEEL